MLEKQRTQCNKMKHRATTLGVQEYAQHKAYTEWADYHSQQTPMAVYYDSREQHLIEAGKMAKTIGWIAEFGVDAGYTLKILASEHKGIPVYGFDAWHKKGPGLPDRWTGNTDFSKAFTWSKKEYMYLKKTMPRNVKLIPGLFDAKKIRAQLVGPAQLVHIDCDTGKSTRQVLDAIQPALVEGTVIVFDEYANYPGWREHEFKAWQEFAKQWEIKYEYLGISNMDVSIKIITRRYK